MNTPTLREQIDLYYQNLLVLQFQASDDISHNPTKGTMREEFIKGMIESNFPNIKLGKGILTKASWESTQIDLFKIKPNARIDKIGGQNITELDDCMLIMEIKSDATSDDIIAFNDISKTIKSFIPEILCGMFCYNISLKSENLLKRFGFKYEKPPLDFYIPGKNPIVYSNIDFIFTLEAKKESESPYLVVKDIERKYTVVKNNPVIKNFLNIFKDIG